MLSTVGGYLVDEHRIKAHHPVMLDDLPMGYVETIDIDDYAAQTLLVRIAETEGMPTVELRAYIESLPREYP